jgi:DmsE family decaheme c-type cytochrome
MTTQARTLSLKAGVVALLLVAVAATLPAEDAEAPPCDACHDEVVAAFAKTVHGLPGVGKPTCVTCHGDGTQHMDAEGDPSLIGKPTGAEGAALCATCHQSQLHRGFSGATAAHTAAGVHCGDCHDVHATDLAARTLLRQEASPLCATCHPAQQAQFERPFGHRLDRGGVQCVSCHDPHAGSGTRSLRTDRSGEGPCVTCHAEKRGPFVFSHPGGVTGDCTRCHTPHGASNPMQLTRATVSQLCLECHSPISGGTLGSQPPSFHDLLSPRYRNCTTCHVAIHGSNSSPELLK